MLGMPGSSTFRIRQQLDPPLVIAAQGSFAFGGTSGADGSRENHGYAQYQIPRDASRLPVLLWHGGTTSGSCWESTPDGRAGFQTLLVRMGFACYVIDQPRKGRAGAGGSTASVSARRNDRSSWNTWRLGVWEEGGEPTVFPGLQLPCDDHTIDQCMRRRTPDSGPAAPAVVMAAVSRLLNALGQAIVVVHSNSGQYAWQLPAEDVSAIIAFEPGRYAFPADAMPCDVPTENAEVRRVTEPLPLPAARFDDLARKPILLVYGDNITDEPSGIFGVELWRVNRIRARQFAAALRQRGADVTLLELPEREIYGNTHFPFWDLNNAEIAGLVRGFLRDRGLT
jgi:hypothetical protein